MDKIKVYKILSSCLYVISITLISAGICGTIVTDSSLKRVSTTNNNLHKTVSTKELMNCFQNISKSSLTPVLYNEFDDAVFNSKYYPTTFVGNLAHYSLDCKKCSTVLSCNNQDTKNGNIYYNDPEYGKVRIISASELLPCGSIIRFNTSYYDDMYVIVLDRGVSGNKIELLKESKKIKTPFENLYDVEFDILRYGY